MAEDWRPTARWAALRRRAELLATVRRFFAQRQVLEVETPLLAAAGVTDLHLHSLTTEVELDGAARRRYLQTSPELAMKRLLAAGSGPIYQICKAFRDGEAGGRHNPEFTILEWYRPGFDHHALMGEIDELLSTCLGTSPGERLTYRELFQRSLGLDPLTADTDQLRAAAAALGPIPEGFETASVDDWLLWLLAEAVEPGLGRQRPTFVHGFPASQAALARLDESTDPPTAERFEVWVEGVELGNGFHELTDPVEQRRRFAADLRSRRRRGLGEPPIDERFLAALGHGLPPSAGVAIGFDRLVMLATDARRISEVLAFPVDRA